MPAKLDMAIATGTSEHSTRTQETVLRTIFDLSPYPMWVFDVVTLRFLAVNQVAVRAYGFSEAEFLTMSILDIRSPAEVDRLSEYLAALGTSLRTDSIWRHRTKSGSEIDVDIFAQAIPDWGGNSRLVQARDVTIERRAIRALEASERRFRDIFEHTTGFICMHDFDGILLSVNPAAAAALGYGVGDLIGAQFRNLFAPELRHLFDEYLQRIARNREDAGYMNVLCRSGAEVVWQYRNRMFVNSDGTSCVIAHAQDVTAVREAKSALHLSEQRLRTIADTLPVKVATIDTQQRLVFANEAYRRAYCGGATDVTGLHLKDVYNEERYAMRLPFLDRAMNGERVVFEEEVGEGDDYHCMEAIYTPEFDRDGKSVIGVHAMMQDVSSKKSEQRRLIRLANIDSLTGLLNRKGFYERLEHAIDRSRDQGTLLALFYLDIDHFKQVNDAYGHAVGDALLCSFATRLGDKVRASDVVARLGGDEFTLVMESIPGPERVHAIAANLVAAMRRPFDLENEGPTLSVGASIGVAMARATPLAAAEFVRRADEMLYAAKEAGRGTYRMVAMDSADRTEEVGSEVAPVSRDRGARLTGADDST